MQACEGSSGNESDIFYMEGRPPAAIPFIDDQSPDEMQGMLTFAQQEFAQIGAESAKGDSLDPGTVGPGDGAAYMIGACRIGIDHPMRWQRKKRRRVGGTKGAGLLEQFNKVQSGATRADDGINIEPVPCRLSSTKTRTVVPKNRAVRRCDRAKSSAPRPWRGRRP